MPCPQAGRGFITDGQDGSVVVFDLKTNAVLGKIAAAEDADGIIYDPASDRLLVSCGDANVLIPINPAVDTKSGKADEAIKLGGKPEFLATDGKGKAYVNLVDKDLVAVVDTKAMKLLTRWPVAPGASRWEWRSTRPRAACSSVAAAETWSSWMWRTAK